MYLRLQIISQVKKEHSFRKVISWLRKNNLITEIKRYSQSQDCMRIFAAQLWFSVFMNLWCEAVAGIHQVPPLRSLLFALLPAWIKKRESCLFLKTPWFPEKDIALKKRNDWLLVFCNKKSFPRVLPKHPFDQSVSKGTLVESDQGPKSLQE